ncbi:hypothetical protein J0A71_03g05790 [Encephalitozoon cuniculi]|nr:hypothetical protein J0A71_03g05790 [Encephalitozoon cuniculi]
MEQPKGLRGVSARLSNEEELKVFNAIISSILEALLFYKEKVLGSIMDSPKAKKEEEGISAVQAALSALEALRKAVSENPITTSSDQDIKLEEFLLCINGLVKEFQDLYKAFIEALKRLLPHIDGSIKIDVQISNQLGTKRTSTRNVILFLLQYRGDFIAANNAINCFF